MQLRAGVRRQICALGLRRALRRDPTAMGSLAAAVASVLLWRRVSRSPMRCVTHASFSTVQGINTTFTDSVWLWANPMASRKRSSGRAWVTILSAATVALAMYWMARG